MKNDVIWKEIPFAPGYKVSNFGDVIGRRGKVLRPFKNRDGYIVHTFCVDGVIFKKTAHSVVCEVFNGLKPSDKLHCAHKDGNKENNTPANLRWATPTENAEDGLRLGKYRYGRDHWTHQKPERVARGLNNGMRKNPHKANRGEDRYNSTITNEQAKQIREAHRRPRLIFDLMKEYGVSRHVINDIRNGRSYRHV